MSVIDAATFRSETLWLCQSLDTNHFTRADLIFPQRQHRDSVKASRPHPWTIRRLVLSVATTLRLCQSRAYPDPSTGGDPSFPHDDAAALSKPAFAERDQP